MWGLRTARCKEGLGRARTTAGRASLGLRSIDQVDAGRADLGENLGIEAAGRWIGRVGDHLEEGNQCKGALVQARMGDDEERPIERAAFDAAAFDPEDVEIDGAGAVGLSAHPAQPSFDGQELAQQVRGRKVRAHPYCGIEVVGLRWPSHGGGSPDRRASVDLEAGQSSDLLDGGVEHGAPVSQVRTEADDRERESCHRWLYVGDPEPMFKLTPSELGIVLFIVLLVVAAGKLRAAGEALGSLLYRLRAGRRSGGGAPPG
jgi:hypothetical protein